MLSRKSKIKIIPNGYFKRHIVMQYSFYNMTLLSKKSFMHYQLKCSEKLCKIVTLTFKYKCLKFIFRDQISFLKFLAWICFSKQICYKKIKALCKFYNSLVIVWLQDGYIKCWNFPNCTILYTKLATNFFNAV